MHFVIRYHDGAPEHTLVKWRVDPYPTLSQEPVKPFRTFRIPYLHDSVVFASAPSPFQGHIMSIWMHAHTSSGCSEAWYFTSPVNQVLPLSLQTEAHSGFVVGDPYSYLRVSYEDPPPVDINRLREYLNDRTLKPMCTAIPESTNRTYGDRRMRHSCRFTYIRTGDFVTVIGFFHPPSELREPIFQHMHFQMLIDTGNIEPYLTFEHEILGPRMRSRLASSSSARKPSVLDFDWQAYAVVSMVSLIGGACFAAFAATRGHSGKMLL